MRYLLVIGFSCDVYRRQPRARIFFDNQIIDEFNIQDQQEKKELINPNKSVNDTLRPCDSATNREYHIKSLPLLRFYEIEIDNQLKQANIRVDIDNNDSSYANGFMKRSTLIQFRVLSLLPFDKKIYKHFAVRMNNQRISNRYAWYRKDIINTFFTYINYGYCNIKWIGNNGQKKNASATESIGEFKIGGSGSLHCELVKKYGVLVNKMLDVKRPYLYIIHRHFLIDYFYYKYEQYANQRNYD